MSDAGAQEPQEMDTPLHIDPQSPNASDGDHNKGSTTSLEGQLLSCILKLMWPTISEHLHTSDDHIESQLRKAAASDEGKNLISALNNFIRVSVVASIHLADNASASPPIEMRAESAGPSLGGTDDFGRSSNKISTAHTTALQPHIPKEVQPTELESLVQRQTRAHVYNNMPIRMLEFDVDGSNIKLIGREDIFRILMMRIQEEISSLEFQRDWTNALGLRDVHNIWYRERSDRMNEMVETAVSRISSYAILSHTWIRQSPGDIVFNTWNSRSSNSRGWEKVKGFCSVAANEYNMTLGWMDTICINKESSSELDESIRSMYEWYRRSHICITYLSETEALGEGAHDSWFTRGWTLQELLASRTLALFNRYWKLLGTNTDKEIISLVTAETTITAEEMAMCSSGHKDHIPVSRILQMASQRQVTREEDSTYSLLGLLDVKISVAYGEGEQSAFRRLFQEILLTRKHVLDLFNRRYHYNDSLVPSSLKAYSNRSKISDKEYRLDLDYHPPEPVILTHLGLRCQWLLFPSLTVPEGASDVQYTPKGNYSAQNAANMVMPNGDELEIVDNLLDHRIYDDHSSYIHPLSDVLHIHSQKPTYAVPNFTLKGDILLLPKHLMAIKLYSPDKPGTVHTGSEIHILGMGCPAHFSLLNRTGICREIPLAELEPNGMQLITLYL